MKTPSFSPEFELSGKIIPTSSDKNLGANAMPVKAILITFMSLILLSCSNKNASSVVNLKIIKGNAFAGGASVDGGILLMGRSEDGRNSFRTGLLQSENIELDLAKGRWEFAAISWQGSNGVMTGDNRCSYTGFIDLKDDQASVTFNLNMGNCKSTFNGRDFADSNFIESSGKFFNFKPRLCLDETLDSPKCSNASNPSTLGSYRIVYAGEARGMVEGRINPLVSSCFVVNGAISSNIPVTGNTFDNPLKPKIKFYKNSTCENASALEYSFDQSILDTTLPDWSSVVDRSPDTLFLINPGAKFDSEAFIPSTIIFNGEYADGFHYFKDSLITFNISGIPANVSMFCATLSECSINDWHSINLLNTPILIPGLTTDDTYPLKVFYKTVAGVVGTHRTDSFRYDTTPPSPTDLPYIAPGSGGIDVTWTTGDSSAFKQWIVQLCSDSSCSTVVKNKSEFNFFSKTTSFSTSELANLTSGNYYARVKTIDLFNRFNYSSISTTYHTIP